MFIINIQTKFLSANKLRMNLIIPFVTPKKYNLLKDIFTNVDNQTSNISKEEKSYIAFEMYFGKIVSVKSS